jgi:hypothetical protein
MTGQLLNPAEALRNPATSMAPDPRTGMFAGQILLSLDAHHADIPGVQLSPPVPEAIAIQFETARNLYLYARHVYRSYMVAATQALTTLEFGLRQRLPAAAGGRDGFVANCRARVQVVVITGALDWNDQRAGWPRSVQRPLLWTGKSRLATNSHGEQSNVCRRCEPTMNWPGTAGGSAHPTSRAGRRNSTSEKFCLEDEEFWVLDSRCYDLLQARPEMIFLVNGVPVFLLTLTCRHRRLMRPHALTIRHSFLRIGQKE